MLQLAPTLEVDLTNVNVSSGDFYQALLGCDVLGGLHAGGQQILGPAVIRMAAPGAPGCVTWLQAKSGCVAYARMLAPPGRANSTTGGLPPPPPTTSATFESEGVRLSEAHKKQLREICSERDA